MIELNAIRLRQAVLCVGCDVISDSPHDACLVCGSRSLLPLSRVLGAAERPAAHNHREVKAEAPPVLVLLPTLPHRNRQRAHSQG
jgi:hypothetical protein